MRLYNLLFRLTLKMRNNKIGKILYDWLEFIGIRIVVSRFANWRTAKKNRKKPNEQMINSRMFFRNNADRVKHAMDLLYDSESKDIYKKMIRFRCNSEYGDLPYNSMRKQYFGNEFFVYNNKEVFIDCGAYDGDSIISYKKHIKKIGVKQNIIIAFEPDEVNYQNLMRNHPDILGIQAGVWKEDGILYFNQDGTNNSEFVDVETIKDIHFQGNTRRVSVKSIDNVKECRLASFIKMDIEGAEYMALLGAKNTIQKNRPKLAICIYHSDEDMVRLIELIHEMVPEYKFYIRQHSNSIYETVLYCTI